MPETHNTINGRTPEEIKARIDYCRNVKTAGDCMSCPYVEDADVCASDFMLDSFDYIQQIEEEKKHLQERICNQRRQLRVLHAMYEWALGRLQKANLNDRAHFQAFLRARGYDLATMELPKTRYQWLEERIVNLNKTSEQLERELEVERQKYASAIQEAAEIRHVCLKFGETILELDDRLKQKQSESRREEDDEVQN